MATEAEAEAEGGCEVKSCDIEVELVRVVDVPHEFDECRRARVGIGSRMSGGDALELVVDDDELWWSKLSAGPHPVGT